MSGKIKSENNALQNILIEFNLKKAKTLAVSNNEGFYQFKSQIFVLKDTLNIKINKLGFIIFNKQIVIDSLNTILDIDLEKNIETLSDVVVSAKNKVIKTAGKSTYKINQKKYIENTIATDVLKTIPNVFYTENKGAIVEGNLPAKIFIDGLETNEREIKTIKASEIDKVEVISNPTAIYGSDFLGAVINIITKKTKEQFIKGSLNLNGGIRNNLWSVSPNLIYKKGIFNVKANLNYLQSNQIVNGDLTRNETGGTIQQNTINNGLVIQQYAMATAGLLFSEKSDLILSTYNGGFKIKGNTNGNVRINNAPLATFINNDNTIDNELDVSSVYRNKITANNTLFIKNKFNVFKNEYNSQYFDQALSFFDNRSKIAELSTQLTLDMQGLKVFKTPTNVIYDLKYINRNYDFSNNSFYLNQNIIDATADMSNDWSEKISTQLGLTFEHLSNKNNVFLKNYNLVLPTLNLIYHFKNNYDVKLGFSQKILRPGTEDLNETLIVYSPKSAYKGNSNLDQQTRNYYSINLDKQFENDNLSFKIYRKTINNSIVSVYKTQDDLLVKTFENASRYNSTGFNFDFTTKIFKKVDVNFNSGLNYDVYESDESSTLIRKNNGITFTSSLYMSSKIFKDKLSVSFSGDFNGPVYTLVSKRVSYPYFDLTASTNLFKKKISLNLNFANLLGDDATIVRNTSFSNNFEQTQTSRNNSSNVSLSLTYNFGKKFEDVYNDNAIENDDIRKKR